MAGVKRSPSSRGVVSSTTDGTAGTAVPRTLHGHATATVRVATAPMLALSSVPRTRIDDDPWPVCTYV